MIESLLRNIAYIADYQPIADRVKPASNFLCCKEEWSEARALMITLSGRWIARNHFCRQIISRLVRWFPRFFTQKCNSINSSLYKNIARDRQILRFTLEFAGLHSFFGPSKNSPGQRDEQRKLLDHEVAWL